MAELQKLLVIIACVRSFYAGSHNDAPAPASKPVIYVDAGPLYVKPDGTGKATINGIEYGYVASKERESQIIEGFKKLRLSQTRDEVRVALGRAPDRARPSRTGKSRNAPLQSWDYTYEIRMQDLEHLRGGFSGDLPPGANDVFVVIFFDRDGKLCWAVPANIEGLREIGSLAHYDQSRQ